MTNLPIVKGLAAVSYLFSTAYDLATRSQIIHNKKVMAKFCPFKEVNSGGVSGANLVFRSMFLA
jgi:hypothetical protein